MGAHDPLLAGASIRRVDHGENVAALEVRLPGETLVVIVAITRGVRGVGIVSPEERRTLWGPRLPAGSPKPHARALLEGGHIIAVGTRGVVIARAGQTHVVSIEGPRVVLGSDLATIGDDVPADDRPAIELRGMALAHALADETIVLRREAIARAIASGITRLDRRIKAIRADLARIGEADDIAARAQWLIAEAVRAPRGARSLLVTDWSTGEPIKIEVPLDPSKPARAQIEAMFHRARRLKRGAVIASDRVSQAEAIHARLVGLTEQVPSAPTLGALEELMTAARAAAPKDVAGHRAPIAGATRDASQPSLPYRVFLADGGTRVLVGKGAARNDTLTFQIARPHDLWLHAKGFSGAHVIVPMAKKRDILPGLLVDAATLAAHFSDARGEAVVEVQYAPRKYVRKPKGGAPGLVLVEREKVIAVRLEPARLKALLEAEETPAGQ